MTTLIAIDRNASRLEQAITAVAEEFEDRLALRWADEIPAVDRVSVVGVVTADHEVSPSRIAAWQASFPRLQALSLAFTGYERVDRAACGQAGLEVRYVPGYSTASVADLTIALALCVLRRIPAAGLSTRRGTWDAGLQPGGELDGKTIAILGTGAIGCATARRFVGFGCSILGWSRTKRKEFVELGGRYRDDLDEVLDAADIAALHLPMDATTERIVGADRLRLLGPTAVLVNTSRAGLVDNGALANALIRRELYGAGIDAFDDDPLDGPEKVAGDPLLQLTEDLDNLVVTPHLGFKTREAYERLVHVSLENLCRRPNDSTNRLVAGTRSAD